MKRFFLVLGILALISCSAKAAENNLEIEFKEFCPYKKLQNIDTSKRYILPSKQYWAERKRQFNERINYCNMQEDKESCFNELRVYENNKTQLYYSELNSNLNKMNLIIYIIILKLNN